MVMKRKVGVCKPSLLPGARVFWLPDSHSLFHFSIKLQLKEDDAQRNSTTCPRHLVNPPPGQKLLA